MANSIVSGSSDEAYGFNLAWIEEGSGIDEEICGVDKDCIVVPSSPTLPKMEQMSNNHYIEIQNSMFQVTEEEVVTDDHWDVQNGFLDFRGAADVDVSTSSGGGMVVDDVLEPLSTEHMERMGVDDLNEYSQLHPFSCDFCPRSFMRKSSLTAHVHTHQQRSHECNMCDAAYDNKEDLMEHMKAHAFPLNGMGYDNSCYSETPYKVKTKTKKKKKKKQPMEQYPPCDALNEIYEAHEPKIKIEYDDENDTGGTGFHEDYKSMVRSKVPKFPVVDPSRPYVCQRCGVGFAREKALVSHQLIHDGDSAVECTRCREVFQSETDLAEHRRTEHSQRPGASTGKVKSSYRDIDTDERKTVIKQEVFGEGFTCHMCNVVFETVDEILSHKEQHDSDLGVHACPFCPDVYEQLAELNEHINEVHSQSHACSVCHRLFKDQMSLDRHLLSHSQEKAKCNVCGRKFYTKIALKRHMSSHEDKPSIICVDCGAVDFPDGSSLLRHRQVEHGINLTRLFPCFECGKTFNSRSSQQIHIRIHTGERPYSCRFCWKAFGDGGTLRKHERIHTGEKPYVCPVCSKAFNQRVVLREHVRAHHSGSEGRVGESSYECLVCGQMFTSSTDLCAHLVGHSDENTAKHRLPSSNQPRTKRKPSSSTATNNKNKIAQLTAQLPQTNIMPASTISSYTSRTSPVQYRPGEIQFIYSPPKKKSSPVKLLNNGSNISSLVSDFMDFGGENHNMNLDDFDDIIEDATDVLRAASCGTSPSSSRTSNTYNLYTNSKKAARIVRSGHKGFHKGQNKRFLNKKESKNTTTKARPVSNGVSYASRYVVSQPEHDVVPLASGSTQTVVDSAEALEWRSRPRTKNVSYHQLKIEPKYERATFPLSSDEAPPASSKKSKTSKKKSKRKSGSKHSKQTLALPVAQPIEIVSVEETVVTEKSEDEAFMVQPEYMNGIGEHPDSGEPPVIIEESTVHAEEIEIEPTERVEAIETCIVQDDFVLDDLNHHLVGCVTNGGGCSDDEDDSQDLSWSRPGEFACDMCHLVFPSYEDLSKHIPMHI